jgi:hypothetical protein
MTAVVAKGGPGLNGSRLLCFIALLCRVLASIVFASAEQAHDNEDMSVGTAAVTEPIRTGEEPYSFVRQIRTRQPPTDMRIRSRDLILKIED